MIQYKKVSAVLFSLLLTAGIPLAAEDNSLQLDFSSAILQMNNTNALLQSVRYEKEKSDYDKKSAMGLFFPKIDINFTYTHLNDPIEMDFNPLRDAMIGLSAQAYAGSGGPGGAAAFINSANSNPSLARSNFIETLQEQDFWTVAATVKQPVFTGGKILAANRAAEANRAAASEKVRYTQNALLTELAQRYYSLRLAMKVVDVRKEVLDGMAAHLNQATKMQENGMISNAEKLHAEVAYSEAEREYKKALRDKDTVLSALKNTLSSNAEITPVSELFMSENIRDISYYKEKAVQLNPVLAQMKANQELAHQGYMKEIARYSPDIFVFGSANVLHNNLGESTPEWYVGAGATMTIFDGLSRYNSVKSASATEKRVAAAMRQANRDIETLVEKSYNELMKDVEQIQTLEKSVEFAEEYLRVRDTAFKAGFGNSIDVVDARLNLSKVKIERLQALYEFDVSLARLLEVSGISDQYENYRKDARTESDILTIMEKNGKPLSRLR